MNTTQNSVVSAVQAAAGVAWIVSWAGDHVRIAGNPASKLARGKLARIEFDDAASCEGARFTGCPGGLSGAACTLAAIAVTDADHARKLIAGFEDEDERADLLFVVFGEE